MENLNAEQIVKGLEICANGGDCKECPINPRKGNYGYCTSLAIKNALALINQLDEENTKLANMLLEKDVIILEQGKFVDENERLKTELRQTAQKLKAAEEANEKLTVAIPKWAKQCVELEERCMALRADTVREMQERLKGAFNFGHTILEKSICDIIDQIAKEMVEG